IGDWSRTLRRMASVKQGGSAGFERVQHHPAARREPVADLEALGQPQLLELADVALERRGLSVKRCRQAGRAPGRVRGDELEDRAGPGPGVTSGVHPGELVEHALE